MNRKRGRGSLGILRWGREKGGFRDLNVITEMGFYCGSLSLVF